jgi:hypothetical protein
MDNSGRIEDLKSPVDRIGKAPRATPYRLARLPNIRLQERYQRFCKAFILVIFADSSTGVCPVISLQYL